MSVHRMTGNVAAGMIDAVEEIALAIEQELLAQLAGGDLDDPGAWVRTAGTVLQHARRLRPVAGGLRDINEGRSRSG